jgi:hypothetical protein
MIYSTDLIFPDTTAQPSTRTSTRTTNLSATALSLVWLSTSTL